MPGLVNKSEDKNKHFKEFLKQQLELLSLNDKLWLKIDADKNDVPRWRGLGVDMATLN
jgi:hypothetical protein